MRRFTYLPILKAKQGELRALSWLRGRVRPNVLPLWELLPPDPMAKTMRGADPKLLDDAWPHRMLVDHRHLAACWGEHETIVHAFRFYASGLARCRAIPVLHADTSNELRRVLIQIARARGDGLGLRLTSDDLIDTSRLEALLSELLTTFELSPASIDLIVDLAAISYPIPDRAVIELASNLARVPLLRSWRTFVLAGGSFPESLAKFAPGHIARIPRVEWNLWDQLREAGVLSRMPEFGDYAVQNPNLPPPGGRPRWASPSLRYTANRQWLIVRGNRHKGAPVLSSQFRDRCLALVAENEFAGQFLCDGDEAIARCAAGTVESGDQSYWRAVATDHHITLVWDQLAELADSQAA